MSSARFWARPGAWAWCWREDKLWVLMPCDSRTVSRACLQLSAAGVVVGKQQQPSDEGSAAVFALWVHGYTELCLFALREKRTTAFTSMNLCSVSNRATPVHSADASTCP